MAVCRRNSRSDRHHKSKDTRTHPFNAYELAFFAQWQWRSQDLATAWGSHLPSIRVSECPALPCDHDGISIAKVFNIEDTLVGDLILLILRFCPFFVYFWTDWRSILHVRNTCILHPGHRADNLRLAPGKANCRLCLSFCLNYGVLFVRALLTARPPNRPLSKAKPQ